MMFMNNLYLVVAAVALLMPVTGLLWPDGNFKSWHKITAPEVFWPLVMSAFSVLPGFRWETRGLLLAALVLNASLFLRQRKQKRSR
jgi:hypothetical protein